MTKPPVIGIKLPRRRKIAFALGARVGVKVHVCVVVALKPVDAHFQAEQHQEFVIGGGGEKVDVRTRRGWGLGDFF